MCPPFCISNHFHESMMHLLKQLTVSHTAFIVAIAFLTPSLLESVWRSVATSVVGDQRETMVGTTLPI